MCLPAVQTNGTCAARRSVRVFSPLVTFPCASPCPSYLLFLSVSSHLLFIVFIFFFSSPLRVETLFGHGLAGEPGLVQRWTTLLYLNWAQHGKVHTSKGASTKLKGSPSGPPPSVNHGSPLHRGSFVFLLSPFWAFWCFFFCLSCGANQTKPSRLQSIHCDPFEVDDVQTTEYFLSQTHISLHLLLLSFFCKHDCAQQLKGPLSS